MSFSRGLRALARVELRGLRKHPGRSILIALLVAVPVAAIAGGSALTKITTSTAEERRVHAMGRAAMAVSVANDKRATEVRQRLGADARVATVHHGRVRVVIPGRRLTSQLHVVEAADLESGGLAEGLFAVDEGRAPAAPSEVALSPVLMKGLSRGLGQTVTLVPGGERTITGVVVDTESLRLPIVVAAPGADLVTRESRVLVDDASEAAALREAGFEAVERLDIGGPDGFEQFAVLVVGSIGLFEAALVIAAAFAVGLRRRQREIGLLGSSGATQGGIQLALIVSAAALAVLGGLFGLGVGAGTAALIHPHLDGWTGRRNGPFELSAPLLVGALLLGCLTAVLAAALPARSAARLPIRVALSGRRPAPTHSGRWLVAGVATVGLGVALLIFGTAGSGAASGFALIGGSILGVLGLGGCSPWLLERLAQWASPLPLSWRLAARDAGRFRARYGPVVTAVLAGMAISVTVAALFASLRQLPGFDAEAMRSDWLLIEGPEAEGVAQRVGEEFGAVATARLAAAYSQGRAVAARYRLEESDSLRYGWIACGDANLLRALGVEGGVDALGSGRTLALLRDTKLESATLFGASAKITLPEAFAAPAEQGMFGPAFVLGREALAQLGFEEGPPPTNDQAPWVVRLDGPVSDEALEGASAIAAESVATSVDANVLHPSQPGIFYRLVLLICFATGLVVLVVATSLSSVESAADARLLNTIGASPALLHKHLAAQTGYLALLGCVLAIPAGMLPAIGLVSVSNATLELVVPWTEVLFTVLGLPAAAYFGTWLFAVARSSFRSTST